MRRRGRRRTAVASLAVLVLSGCARMAALPPTGSTALGAEETGLASWYGHPYHGRRTAGGEVYDMNDLTAAHRTLPLGTRIMVTNLDSGQAVEVRVNDRGPFVDGRVLDLSYAAARVLGADRAGVVPIRLRVVALAAPAFTALPAAAYPGPAAPAVPRPPAAVASAAVPDGWLAAPAAGSPPAQAIGAARSQGAPMEPAAPSSDLPTGQFAVQLGAFTSRARADALRDAVEREGDAATVSETRLGGDTFYRVRVGSYADRDSARLHAERLAARGYRVVVVER